MPGGPSDPRDTFSDSAERYLVSTDHRSGPDLEVIRQVASQLLPLVMADVAAGAGHALMAAAPFSGSGIAMDLTMEMLKTARGHLAGTTLENALFIQSVAGSLPLADGTISLLTCRIAPHHFPSISGFLFEVFRVLKPHGRAVIIDSIAPEDAACARFINEVEKLRDPSHVHSHGLKQWLAFFETAGLETVSVQLFERDHPFREWAVRTGLDEEGVRTLEERFKQVPALVRDRFKIQLDEEGKVDSYTDEKGIFVVKNS